MFKSKESKVAAIILLTLALLLIAGMFPQYDVAGIVIVALIIGALWVYAAMSGKTIGQPKDERSERCSLMATHNAFMATFLLTAFVLVAVQAGWLRDAVTGLQSIWLLGMTVYLLSYLAYKRIA